jgi:hypothetical protein
MENIIEYLMISIPIVLSGLSIVVAVAALMMGLRVVILEKQVKILELHKHLLISQMVLFSDTDHIRGYDVLEYIKNQYHVKDDYEAMKIYYNKNMDA